MSFTLDNGTKPKGLELKTLGIGGEDIVYIGDYEISLKDFLFAASYVLMNTNLIKDDPRLAFVERVRSMQVVEGFPLIIDGQTIKTERLAAPLPDSEKE